MDPRVSQFLKRKKQKEKIEPAWVRPEARVYHSERGGREGPNVGFPALTHDRVAVRNLHRIPAPTCLVS